MAEIVSVVSEALEAQVRDLLPSQRGFGEDLQASNVITPIIDLTAVAEGTNVPEYQQQAQAFGSQTTFAVTNTTTTLANTAGFWRIQGVMFVNATGSASINSTDGVTVKALYNYVTATGSSSQNIPFDVTMFLAAGESVTLTANASAVGYGSYRQLADVNGTPVNPSGFTPQ